MLQFIRERSEGWFAWTIVIAIAITFILWGVHTYFYSNQRTEVVATVDGIKITHQQFNNWYNYLKRQQEMTGEPSSKQKPKAILENIALQSIISNLVLTRAAQKSGFYVSEAMIANSLARMPIFQEKGSFSKERFQQVLGRLGLSLNELESSLTSNFLLDQVQLGLINSAFVLPDEIKRIIQLLEQKRSFEYGVLSADQYLKQIVLSEAEIKDYYQSHTEDFRIPETLSIEYVLLSIDNLEKKINPTEEELKTFFSSNPSLFQSIQKNRSNVVWNNIKTRVLQSYRQQKVQQQFMELSDQLANMTYENPTSLEPAAQQLDLSIQSTPFFSKTGGQEAITRNTKVIAAAFSPDVLDQANNSEPINLNDGSVMVLRIKQHHPTQIKSLNSVRSEIVKQLTKENAKTLAHNKANEIATRLNQKGGTLQSWVPASSWKKVNLAKRYERQVDPIILNAVFNFPRLAKNKVIIASLASGDTAIIQINHIQEGTVDAAKEKFFSRQIANSFGLMDYQLYVQSCIHSSKIVIKQSSTDSHDPRDY